MMINGRLLLLVVAAGLFVRVWAANERPRAPYPARSRSQVSSIEPPPDQVGLSPAYAVVSQPVSLTSRSTPSVDSDRLPLNSETSAVWTAATCPIPLPAGIASGAYRMVDATGRVARLEIASDIGDVGNGAPSTARPEFYVMASGSERWYLIRLQMPADEQPVAQLRDLPLPRVDAAPQPTPDSRSSIFSNRKYDFTGYITPEQGEESRVEEIARPEPPDLPVPR